MNLLRTLTVCCMVLTPSLVWCAGPATDPFLGRWVLQPGASHYPGNTCPKGMTIEMTREARGIHYHSHTEPRLGEAFDVEYTADYDGKPAMVTGSRGILLPVSLERRGDAVIATYRSALQVAATSKRVLSADGSAMTITTTSYDAEGTAVSNVGVYRRDTSWPALKASTSFAP